MQVAVRCCPILLDFQQNIAFLESSQVSPVYPSVTVTCKWQRAWSVGGIICAENSRSTRRKSYFSAALPTTNLTWTGPERTRVSTVKARRLTTWSTTRWQKLKLTYIIHKVSVRIPQRTVCFITKAHQLLLYIVYCKNRKEHIHTFIVWAEWEVS